MPSIPTLDQVVSTGDWLTTYKWWMTVLKWPNALPTKPDVNDINIRMESLNLSNKSDQTILINVRGFESRQPGIYNFGGTFDCTFLDSEESLVINKLVEEWKTICWNTNTGYQFKKKDVIALVEVVQANRQGEKMISHKYHNVYLSDHSPVALDNASDVIRYNLTFTFDKFEVVM